MADDKTTKTPEQPVTDSGPGKETPPAPPKEPEKVSVSPEPEKKTEPEVKNPQVSVYNFAEIMKEKKVEERAAAPSGETVSYTHLDVYKRQHCRRRYGVSPGHGFQDV